MNGRLLVRGDAALHMLVRDDIGSLQQIVQTVPFTQMVDVEGLAENETVTLRLAVRGVDCVLEKGGVLSVGIGASALILRAETHMVRTIRDLYQTKHELNVCAGQINIHQCALCGNFSADSSETVPIGMQVSQYIYAKAVCTEGIFEEEDTIRLKVDAEILYLDDEGSAYQTHRTLSLPVHLNTSVQGLSPQDFTVAVTASPSGEDSVNLRFAVSGLMMRSSPERIQDITKVEISAEERSGLGDVTLVLRRVDEGEQLWDIAKQICDNSGGDSRCQRYSGGRTGSRCTNAAHSD